MKFYCKKNLVQKYIQIYLQIISDFLKIDKFVGSVSMGRWFMWYIYHFVWGVVKNCSVDS